jgi:transposase
VKPYVKTNKSDYIDAEAIAEAVGRPTMRFVPIKTDDQLDLQSLHRVRERWVMRRTAVVNQIRGLLQERGITLRKGRCHLDAALPGILEDGTSKLSGAVRLLLAQLKLNWFSWPYGSKKPMRWFRRPHRRAKSVDAWMRFPVSDRLRQRHSSQPSVMERPFARAGSSQPGWG